MKFHEPALPIILLATAAAITGCTSLTARHAHPIATFSEALNSCRSMQPNRLMDKRQLPPTNSRISECLQQHGWTADGNRLHSDGEPAKR